MSSTSAATPPRFEDKYEMGSDEIGAGATAVVKTCIGRDGVEYAVKIMDRKNVYMDEAKFDEEIAVLSRLRHKNIIKLVDVFRTSDQILVVTELATGGELFDRIMDEGNFDEKHAASITRRLFDAIKHMHEKGICHRDLKPENIMFMNETKQSPLKIVDFGFASSLLSKKKKFQTMSQLGTIGYAAPEVFTGRPYTEKCDVWSLGVIVYILLCGFPPFVDMSEESKEEVQNTPFWVYVNKMQSATDEDIPLEFPTKFWAHVSPAAKDFLRQVLVADPNKRPRAAQALGHSWLKEELKFGSLKSRSPSNLTMRNMRKFKRIRKHAAGATLGELDFQKLDKVFEVGLCFLLFFFLSLFFCGLLSSCTSLLAVFSCCFLVVFPCFFPPFSHAFRHFWGAFAGIPLFSSGPTTQRILKMQRKGSKRRSRSHGIVRELLRKSSSSHPVGPTGRERKAGNGLASPKARRRSRKRSHSRKSSGVRSKSQGSRNTIDRSGVGVSGDFKSDLASDLNFSFFSF